MSLSFAAAAITMDEKKRKRMQSNRESAKRSRLKREQRLKDLVNEIQTLQERISVLNRQYTDMSHRIHDLLCENENLKAKKVKLAKYLNSLYFIYMRSTQRTLQNSGCMSNQRTGQLGKQRKIMGMSKAYAHLSP